MLARIVASTGLICWLTPALAWAQPLNLADPTPRTIKVQFEISLAPNVIGQTYSPSYTATYSATGNTGTVVISRAVYESAIETHDLDYFGFELIDGSASDFTLEASQRRLFPGIEPDVLPGASADSDQRIRAAIVHLQKLLLGRYDVAENDPDVERTYGLFAGIIADAQAQKGIEALENYSCRASGEKRFPDPQYTVRAWRAVVTYLLRQHAFLYE